MSENIPWLKKKKKREKKKRKKKKERDNIHPEFMQKHTLQL